MATVLFNHVTKKFGDFVAVDDFNYEIADKEFVVLVGPSGCGKSTVLRMVAGLEKISEGTIEIGGRVVNKVHPKDRDIAMVFQNYALYPHMTVYKNMAFGLQLRGFSKAEIDSRVREAAEILEISDMLKRKPKELSGGQRQRVAVGRTIVRKPAVFLFDEPLSNLDAKLRVQMRAEIVRLHHRLQSTVIYVTHDQVEAMTMGSKIVIQDSGKIMQAGKPIDVYDSPDNKFVAGFIGSPAMNFVEVRLVSAEDGLWAEGDGFRFPVPSTKAARYAPNAGGKFFLGIRPEHLEDVHFVKEYDPKYIMKAKVELIEPLGSSVILQIVLGGKTLVAQVDSHTDAKVGKEIQLVADLENMHLFSMEYPHKSLDKA